MYSSPHKMYLRLIICAFVTLIILTQPEKGDGTKVPICILRLGDTRWRKQYSQLEEKHADLERDYWQLQGQYSELQSQHRQILRLLSPSRS